MSALDRIAELAPGKRLLVELPGVKAEVPTEPSMADVCLSILKRDQIRDREALDKLAESVKAMAEALSGLGVIVEQQREATAAMAANQQAAVEAVKSVTELLSQPMRPIYDAKGRLVGAERVKQL